MWGLYLKEERYALFKNWLLAYTSSFQGCSMHSLCLFGAGKSPTQERMRLYLKEERSVWPCFHLLFTIYDAAQG